VVTWLKLEIIILRELDQVREDKYQNGVNSHVQSKNDDFIKIKSTVRVGYQRPETLGVVGRTGKS
jgi:hypothetical protein